MSGARGQARYAHRLRVTDLIVVSWAMIGTHLLWFGLTNPYLATNTGSVLSGVPYAAVTVAFIAAWMGALAISGTRDPRILGTGTIEYKRIVDAAVRLFGVIAIIAVLAQVDLSRGYFLTGLPAGMLALLVSRWAWRQWLVAERIQGRHVSRAIVVGSPETARAFVSELRDKPEAGYAVVGMCLIGERQHEIADPLDEHVVVGFRDLLPFLSERDADTVILTGADELTAARVRALSWELEPGRQHLVVAPNVIDVGGPRIHMRPVAGLPLMHVETPRYTGLGRVTKRSLDVVASTLLLVLLAPVFAVIAIGIAASSPGPVFFTQRRVGLGGRPFSMIKFRTMVIDAEQRLAELSGAERDAGNAVMFKLTNDPRITRIGRILRRYSLDELPQLINVLAGQMSLVGPRPPLEREVEKYDRHVYRRFLLKPGITGLWQVSGRSTLSWEETVRLDLYYVHNWSLTGDIVLLWRTIREVVRPRGAF